MAAARAAAAAVAKRVAVPKRECCTEAHAAYDDQRAEEYEAQFQPHLHS